MTIDIILWGLLGKEQADLAIFVATESVVGEGEAEANDSPGKEDEEYQLFHQLDFREGSAQEIDGQSNECDDACGET